MAGFCLSTKHAATLAPSTFTIEYAILDLGTAKMRREASW